MDDRTKILLAGIAAFVLMAWGGAWVFPRVNGYPLEWYWLPFSVTAIVAALVWHARRRRSPALGAQ